MFQSAVLHIRNHRSATFGSYGHVLIYPKDRGNILRRNCFDEIVIVNELIRGISIEVSDDAGKTTTLTYTDLCARWDHDCFFSEAIKINNVVDKVESGQVNLTWPFFFDEKAFDNIILPGSIGKPVLVDDVVVSTPAVGLFFILSAGGHLEASRGKAWELKFLSEMERVASLLNHTDIFYETSSTVEIEFDGLKYFVPAQGLLAGTLVVIYSVFCCMMADWVKAKPWLGFIGVVSTGLATVSSYGFLMCFGLPFTTVLYITPFLMLGIGMEDTFLMLAAWRKTSVLDPVEKRIEETYAEAAVSMTITSLTNVLSFLIGATSSFRVLNIFCVYSGISILFLYIFQITFYGAWLAVFGRLERDNRHSLVFTKAVSKVEAAKVGKSKWYVWLCTGGHTKEEMAGLPAGSADHAVMLFFREQFADYITRKYVKVAIVVAYVAYLAGGIYGVMQLKEGLSLKRLVTDHSYYVSFYDRRYEDFMDYPYRVAIVVEGHLDYSNQTVKDDMERLLTRIEDYQFYAGYNYTDSWLRKFEKLIELASEYTHIDISNETMFNENLHEFLWGGAENKNSLDVLFDEDGRIVASRFIVQIFNLTGLEDVKGCMLFLRQIFKDEFPQYNLTAYTPVFAFAELLIGATQTAISTVSMAAVVMLIVALIMIPESKCALYVGISLVSIELGILGYMSLWGVSLDCVSVGCLVMCIGFSVDFSAHITHSFIASEAQTTMGKLRDAVESAGLPIIQGASSCVLAVVAMIRIPAYVFTIFFKTVCLVMMFGAAHGILLLPLLLLHTAGPKDPSHPPTESGEESSSPTMKKSAEVESDWKSVEEKDDVEAEENDKLLMQTPLTESNGGTATPYFTPLKEPNDEVSEQELEALDRVCL
ncbi:unnamed protein product [Notodromas monacha]|uniref:SSD domain-containing protein n=1 Tax=Notodromas monacha TaxID=399045 RepID=A0A7R9BJD0_9CRUS|nr:unnamed protein product [Notodromas monacha]CAG0916581.1 unnamed protein product [Notodromas monacha]